MAQVRKMALGKPDSNALIMRTHEWHEQDVKSLEERKSLFESQQLLTEEEMKRMFAEFNKLQRKRKKLESSVQKLEELMVTKRARQDKDNKELDHINRQLELCRKRLKVTHELRESLSEEEKRQAESFSLSTVESLAGRRREVIVIDDESDDENPPSPPPPLRRQKACILHPEPQEDPLRHLASPTMVDCCSDQETEPAIQSPTIWICFQ